MRLPWLVGLVLLFSAEARAQGDLLGPPNALSDFGARSTPAAPTVRPASPQQLARLRLLCDRYPPDSEVALAFLCSGGPSTSAPLGATALAEGCSRLGGLAGRETQRLAALRSSGGSADQRLRDGLERALIEARQADLDIARHHAGCPGAPASAPPAAARSGRLETVTGAGGLCGGLVTSWQVARVPAANGQIRGVLTLSLTEGAQIARIVGDFPWASAPSLAPGWITDRCDAFRQGSARIVEAEGWEAGLDMLKRWLGETFDNQIRWNDRAPCDPREGASAGTAWQRPCFDGVRFPIGHTGRRG